MELTKSMMFKIITEPVRCISVLTYWGCWADFTQQIITFYNFKCINAFQNVWGIGLIKVPHLSNMTYVYVNLHVDHHNYGIDVMITCEFAWQMTEWVWQAAAVPSCRVWSPRHARSPAFSSESATSSNAAVRSVKARVNNFIVMPHYNSPRYNTNRIKRIRSCLPIFCRQEDDVEITIFIRNVLYHLSQCTLFLSTD